MDNIALALGAVVTVGRSLPFIILLVAIVPLTRLIVGTTRTVLVRPEVRLRR